MILRVYKYRLYPTKDQKILLAKHFGAVRWVYNYGLARKVAAWKDSQKGISIFEIANELPKLKEREETKWLKEVNAQSLQQSLMNLDRAFTSFFKKKGGFPKFKSRKDNHQGFQCPQRVQVDFDINRIYLPKFKDGVKAVFDRRFQGKIKTVTVSRTPTDKYYVSVLVEQEGGDPIKPKLDENRALGIDLGVKTFATLSDGTKIENPNFLKKKLRKLKREQRRLSRKQKGSKNRDKQRKKVARIHEKVANGRKDFLHKVSHQLVCDNQATTLCVETLGIQDMLQNSKLRNANRAISDVGWGMFLEFLDYKCQRYGKNFIKIGRFEASSKACTCGVINNDLTLNDRIWKCDCGLAHDRDILAANNIKKFAFRDQNTECEALVRSD